MNEQFLRPAGNQHHTWQHLGWLESMRSFPWRASDILIRLRLFLSSYAPLFLILAIRFQNAGLSRAFYALAIVSAIAGLLVVRATRQASRGEWTVSDVDDQGPDVAGYVATYLLPFVTVPDPTWRDLLGYGIFFLIVAVVYIRSDMIQINPTLYLFGWQVRGVTIGEAWRGHLLTRRDVRPGTLIKAARFRDKIFIEY